MLNEIQIKAKAGSVLIQDSRLRHSALTQLDNKKGERVAAVNRQTPWWLAINNYAPDSRFNMVCNPINKSEYKKLQKNKTFYETSVCRFKRIYPSKNGEKIFKCSEKSKKIL